MRQLFCEGLWTADEWLVDVALDIDPAGDIARLDAGATADGRERVEGWTIPGVPNLHGHAHQRAMAGFAERSGHAGADSFWTWRDVMYGHVARMSPEDLEAIAAQLYVEMLEAGYTATAEFQYLHHDPAGKPYDDRAEMSLRCLAAARGVGIGATLLPVLYASGGFGGVAPGDGQKRFLDDLDGFLTIVERLEAAATTDEVVGIAPHSLRAVPPELLATVLEAFDARGPIHIHVAEQLQEVEDCVAWYGQRPIAWLLDHAPVDPSWCVIHATHMTPSETVALASSGTVAGLCPTTEANLGDGLFDAPRFLDAGGRFGIGSDSHISVSPVEELRWLEYGQRLRSHGRAVLSGGADRGTGRALLAGALAGGAQACGRPIGRLAPGRRADLVVLDADHPSLFGRTDDAVLDGWIFSGNRSAVRDVMVAGRWVVRDGAHRDREAVAERYRAALQRLRSEA